MRTREQVNVDAQGRCPCLSGLPYSECCRPFHDGVAAPTAEKLMRSRYSAYALANTAYLADTWHPDFRPDRIEVDEGIRWYRLDILGRTGGGLLDSAGTVEFVAHFRQDGSAGSQHENSRFVRENGRWFYLDAV